MSTHKSKATDHSDGDAKAESSTFSKNVHGNSRAHAQMAQDLLLIWLDSNIDENSTDYQNTISKLRPIVNNIKTFTDGEECIHFLESIDNEKVCMIISGSFGQNIVPRVHTMSQLDSIFIFCGNKKYHEQWAKDWSKIKGVFTEIKPICEALKLIVQQCEQNTTSISIMDNDGGASKKNLDQLEPTFMYSQIMKEILLTIDFEQQHFQEFISYCRGVLSGNERQLANVNKLEQTYRDHTPIWWYTFESFLYSMVNRALRLMDIDVIIKFGFFIVDLHRQIEQLHNEQFGSSKLQKSFLVYRGQGMDKAQFETMVASKGGLLSYNCFLSASKDQDVSLKFAKRATANSDLVGVLFVMTIDPAQATTPFASIVDVGYFGKNDEVLFSMHTVFRLNTITYMDENHRLFKVELTLTADYDPHLRALTDRIREETFPDAEGWYRFGLLLMKMGQPDKAQPVFQQLLEQETDKKAKESIYKQLGRIKCDLGEYENAIEFYEKSLAIEQQSLPPNHPSLASSYNNIGEVYVSMGEYPKAFSLFEKALTIRQQSLPPNHPDLADSYNNIGNVYSNMDDYSKALSSFEKAFTIRQQSLPPSHPDLATFYYNMGLVYEKMGNYSNACSSYEHAVKIEEQALPPNHPKLLDSRKKLADIKKKL